MEERKLNDQRKFWKLIVFSMLTFGIYGIVFYWGMLKDLNTACAPYENDDSEYTPNYLIVVLLTIITCGIYYYFWLYKQGNRISRIGSAYGLQIEEKGSTYLLWQLVGVLLCGVGPLIGEYYFVTNINKLCKVYNYQHNFNTPPGQGAYGNANGSPNGYNGSNGYGTPYGQQDYRGGQYRQQESHGGSYGQQQGGYGYSNASAPRLEEKQAFYNGMDSNTMATQRVPQSRSIRFIKGVYSGAETEIVSGEELIIGRNSSQCNFILSDPDISRKHCSVRYSADDGYFYVTDYSTFGVFMNGSQRLQKGVQTKCPPGTQLSLGEGNNVFILQ
ncbi:MAG: DUF4234 domain-containing protein [Clostridiales bacterium]|nr:DUF4234 domain-containing protein [Clostridiales bacterium]